MNALLIVGLCVLFLIIIVIVFVVIFVKISGSSSNTKVTIKSKDREHIVVTANGMPSNESWLGNDVNLEEFKDNKVSGGGLLDDVDDLEEDEDDLGEDEDDLEEEEELEGDLEYFEDRGGEKGEFEEYASNVVVVGGAKSDPNKPIIIMFGNIGATPLLWSNAIRSKPELEEINFVKKLKRIGEIHNVDLPFNNINYYYNPSDPKISKIFNIYKEQNAYSPDINFTLEDLDFKKICTKIHNDVTEKYGSSREYIIVGHSNGCDLARMFCKHYKSKCKLCVFINDQPYVLNYYKKNNGRKIKSLTKPVNSENKLKKALNTLQTTSNKKEANEIYEHIQNLIMYYYCKNRFENFDPKIYVPTLFFKAIPSKPVDNEKVFARLNRKQKRESAKDSNMKLFKFFKDAESNIWWNQKYSDAIVRAIKKFL